MGDLLDCASPTAEKVYTMVTDTKIEQLAMRIANFLRGSVDADSFCCGAADFSTTEDAFVL